MIVTDNTVDHYELHLFDLSLKNHLIAWMSEAGKEKS